MRGVVQVLLDIRRLLFAVLESLATDDQTTRTTIYQRVKAESSAVEDSTLRMADNVGIRRAGERAGRGPVREFPPGGGVVESGEVVIENHVPHEDVEPTSEP